MSSDHHHPSTHPLVHQYSTVHPRVRSSQNQYLYQSGNGFVTIAKLAGGAGARLAKWSTGAEEHRSKEQRSTFQKKIQKNWATVPAVFLQYQAEQKDSACVLLATSVTTRESEKRRYPISLHPKEKGRTTRASRPKKGKTYPCRDGGACTCVHT